MTKLVIYFFANFLWKIFSQYFEWKKLVIHLVTQSYFYDILHNSDISYWIKIINNQAQRWFIATAKFNFSFFNGKGNILIPFLIVYTSPKQIKREFIPNSVKDKHEKPL